MHFPFKSMIKAMLKAGRSRSSDSDNLRQVNEDSRREVQETLDLIENCRKCKAMIVSHEEEDDEAPLERTAWSLIYKENIHHIDEATLEIWSMKALRIMISIYEFAETSNIWEDVPLDFPFNKYYFGRKKEELISELDKRTAWQVDTS